MHQENVQMAKTNIYLKLDGLDGESVDEDHKNWIEVESWSWGVDNPASFAQGQGGQSTQAHVSSLNVVKHCDKASVTLYKDCTTGKHITSGTLSCLKLDGDSRVEYMKVDLTDVMVSSVQWSASGSEHHVHESLGLVFAEFKQTYKLQQDTGSAQGSTEFGFNVQTSKAT
jgi:type VI secretion system secreted protein Hcp